MSAEERAAMKEAADELEAALGREVTLRSRRGKLFAEVPFDDLAEVADLAGRVRAKRR
jgi:hypothetical protein